MLKNVKFQLSDKKPGSFLFLIEIEFENILLSLPGVQIGLIDEKTKKTHHRIVKEDLEPSEKVCLAVLQPHIPIMK